SRMAGKLRSFCGTKGIPLILMSCTETCFYTMSVYFMTARVSKSRYTLAGALLSTAVGVVMSVLLAYLM
ncbi:MAG: hypothetical protein ACLU7Q_12970, partial [Gallintestinimicrobium sp.]